ncbi:alkaline phosphatase family protein [Trebonia kvetii]|nr:alkaline phosphatase family protein [Trebonia kvetii]
MEENNGFTDVIGNKAAPNLNYLARTFGVATDYFGVSPDSSESNYVAMLGGSTHGVTSDDAYWMNKINAPSLISQLDHAGISWKAYLQGLPHAGYQGICYPARCNGAPDSDPLYVSKHDGIQNFTTSWNSFDWSRQVPSGQLARDLASGNVPRFGYIVPDECHDMHGDPPYCLDSGNLGDPQQQHLDAVGDAYLGQVVAEITHARFWSRGNNAIIITYDNGDDSKGCCDGIPGGGRIATVVVTSHGPRGITDHQPANHYSTLSSIEKSFGLGCLNFTCDTKHVTPISDLLAVTGSKAIATRIQPELRWPTPTPSQPREPRSATKPVTGTRAGFTVLQAQLLGTGDNSVGAIAGSSPKDIWAVGNYLPDQPNSNQDATLTFAEHWNGASWKVVRTPNTGPNFNSFYGLAARDGEAWAVGEHLNSAYQDRGLVEVWNGRSWHVADTPNPGSLRDMFFGASALSAGNVWVVGDQESGNGIFETLAEHWTGHGWSVVRTPDPGSSGNHLYAVDAVSRDDVWAVGQKLGGQAPDQGLVEHWNGSRWSAVPLPVSVSASVQLDAVTVSHGQVWVAGESDSPFGGGKPLVEHLSNGRWHVVTLPAIPHHTNWANLYGIAVANGAVWATGTYVDPATDNNNALVLRDSGGHWTVLDGPDAGSGSNIPGGITTIAGRLWLAGTYDNGGSREPLVARR